VISIARPPRDSSAPPGAAALPDAAFARRRAPRARGQPPGRARARRPRTHSDERLKVARARVFAIHANVPPSRPFAPRRPAARRAAAPLLLLTGFLGGGKRPRRFNRRLTRQHRPPQSAYINEIGRIDIDHATHKGARGRRNGGFVGGWC